MLTPSRKLLAERAAVLGAGAGVVSALAALLSTCGGNKQEIVLKHAPVAAAPSPAVPEAAAPAPVPLATPTEQPTRAARAPRKPATVFVPQIQVPPAPPPLVMRRAILRSRDHSAYLRAAASPDAETVGEIHPDQIMTVLSRDGDYWRVVANGKYGYVRDELLAVLDGDGVTPKDRNPDY